MQLTCKSNKNVFCFAKKFTAYFTISEDHITPIASYLSHPYNVRMYKSYR